MKATAFVHINNQGVVLNNQNISIVDWDESSTPFKALYKHLNITYPKFYKMDNLCKLGFLGVELLKSEIDFSLFENDRITQLFQNSYSSLDTDIVHQITINEGEKPPSPAIFVYTLPNIVMGEIAIRNKFYGENLFTLENEFAPKSLLTLAQTQFKLNKADAVIGGWLELFKNDFNLRLYFIDKNQYNGTYDII